MCLLLRMVHRTPSYVGETMAVMSVLQFAMWATGALPDWFKYFIIPFVFLFLFDWMLGGIADKGLCKTCVAKLSKPVFSEYKPEY